MMNDQGNPNDQRTERRPAFVFIIWISLVIPSSLDLRHLKKATFAFVKRRYRFAQVTRKCSLQI